MKCFYRMFDKENFGQLEHISIDLCMSITELREVYDDLVEKSDKDISDIIRQLQKDEVSSLLHYNSSLYRLRYLRDELIRRSKDLKDPFKSIISELSNLIG